MPTGLPPGPKALCTTTVPLRAMTFCSTAVTARGGLGVAAEVDPAAVVDDQVPACDRELGIRREGDPVATRVSVDDVADDPRPDGDRASTPAPYCPGDAPLQSCSTLPWITAARACSSTTHERPASFKLPGPTREPSQRRRVPPEDHRAGDIQRDGAVRGGQLEVRKGQVPRRLRRLDPVREDGARSARPGRDRDAALGRLAARGDRLSLAEGRARDRQPVCPGASDFASRSSDCSGLAFVPGFVSAPLGAAQRLQRTATGLPPATPTSTLETMIAATTGAPLSTVEV